jgi:hypothetical protein
MRIGTIISLNRTATSLLHRLTMGAGAMTAAVAALEPALGHPQLAAMPAAQALVSSALEIGLRVAVDLRRPPDVTTDEDMVELVDQVREVMLDSSYRLLHRGVLPHGASAAWLLHCHGATGDV